MIISFENLVNSIPEEKRTPELLAHLKNKYEYEVETINSYISKAKNPDAHLMPFIKAGDQLVADFYVNDLGIEKENKINWHFQNVSQWLYAGCILIDHNQVSTHH